MLLEYYCHAFTKCEMHIVLQCASQANANIQAILKMLLDGGADVERRDTVFGYTNIGALIFLFYFYFLLQICLCLCLCLCLSLRMLSLSGLNLFLRFPSLAFTSFSLPPSFSHVSSSFSPYDFFLLPFVPVYLSIKRNVLAEL